MTRRKVKLAFIGNDSPRKTTYKKRKNGMVKKTSELLVTLCGVEACMIIYSPIDAEPEIWPSSMGVQSTIVRFRQTPEMDQWKMTNQMNFTRERIQKDSEQVKKMRKNNREKKLAQIMYHYMSTGNLFLHNMTVNDLHDLKWLIEHNLRDVRRKMKAIMDSEIQIQSQGQAE